MSTVRSLAALGGLAMWAGSRGRLGAGAFWRCRPMSTDWLIALDVAERTEDFIVVNDRGPEWEAQSPRAFDYDAALAWLRAPKSVAGRVGHLTPSASPSRRREILHAA